MQLEPWSLLNIGEKMAHYKVKILDGTTEEEINSFIKDKHIHKIDYFPHTKGHYQTSCFIVYSVKEQ